MRTGDKLTSIRHLSRDCGVSEGIVRKAFDALKAEGFIYSEQGRGFFVSRIRTARQVVVVVVPTLAEEHISRIVRGIKTALADHAPGVLLLAADSDFKQESDLLDRLDKCTVAGAVLYPPPQPEYRVSIGALAERGVPLVLEPRLVRRSSVVPPPCGRGRRRDK